MGGSGSESDARAGSGPTILQSTAGKSLQVAVPIGVVYPRAFSFVELASLIGDNGAQRGALLVGIDGCGGSGKTTVAKGLAAVLPHTQLVHVDDFYLPRSQRFQGPIDSREVGADFDLARLRREVLEPLRSSQVAVYHRYDWQTDEVLTEATCVSGPVVIVEGVYALSGALFEFFNFTIWVDCPRERRVTRGLLRDGDAARQRWEEDWMPGEDKYEHEQRVRDRVSLVCDGNHDVAGEVRVLEGRVDWYRSGGVDCALC